VKSFATTRIGGGLAGSAIAYRLARAGFRTALLERRCRVSGRPRQFWARLGLEQGMIDKCALDPFWAKRFDVPAAA
jgi:flavin-dependent dehydrogenase